jgi:uncharacterized protein (TIGR00369 family)
MGHSANSESRTAVDRIFENAPFVRSLGIELTGYGKGWCETRIRVQSIHRQQHGFVHAGIIMTISDHTCGGAAVSAVPGNRDVITVENKISFLRPAAAADLVCRAQVLRAGRNLVFVEAEVIAEQSGKRVPVAKTSSTLAVIPLGPDEEQQRESVEE